VCGVGVVRHAATVDTFTDVGNHHPHGRATFTGGQQRLQQIVTFRIDPIVCD